MEQITLKQMEEMDAGTVQAWIDGACATYGAYGLLGGPTTIWITAGCVGWGIGRLF